MLCCANDWVGKEADAHANEIGMPASESSEMPTELERNRSTDKAFRIARFGDAIHTDLQTTNLIRSRAF